MSFSIPNGFWKGFGASHWEQRPAVFRRPFGAPIATLDEVFRGLLELQHRRWRLPTGPFRNILRVFFDRSRERGQILCDARDWFPREEDGSLEGFCRRLGDTLEGGHYGLAANAFQAADPAICGRMRRVLGALYDEVGFPTEYADCVMFLGNYRKSPFGVHTDPASVISFVLSGRKRYRVFPGPVLAEHKALHYGARYEPHLGEATTLEGEAGDVFYWPSSYWHVGETDAHEPSVVLNLAIYLNRTPEDLVDLATRRARRATRGTATETLMFPAPGPARGETAIPAEIEREIDQSLADAVGLEGRRVWLERRSCVSLDEYVERRPQPTLTRTSVVRADRELPILYARRGDRLIVAARGDSTVVADAPWIPPLIEALRSGEPVTLDRVAPPDVDPRPLVSELVAMGGLDVVSFEPEAK